MEKRIKNKEQRQLEDEKVVFVPQEFIRSFENIIETAKEAQQEFHKVAESITNYELRIKN